MKKPAKKTHPQQEILEPISKKTNNDVAIVDPNALISQNRAHSNQIINAIINAATTISAKGNALEVVEVIGRLHKLQIIAEDRQAEREFGVAKVAIAREIPTIPKTKSYEFVDKDNKKQTRMYSDRMDIESVLDPLCKKYGFSKEYTSKTNDKGWTCQVLILRHASGHVGLYESPYQPLDTSGAKNNSQAASSTAEYGMKQSLKGAFNIIGVDLDDQGDNINVPPKNAETPDKFTARVQEKAKEEPQAQPPKQPANSLVDAAGLLESKIRNAPQEQRGEILMKHIGIIGAMERDVKFADKAAELRKLCEVQPNG